MSIKYDLFHVDSEGRSVRVEFYVTEGGDARIERITHIDDLGISHGFEMFRTLNEKAVTYGTPSPRNRWMVELANSDEIKWALVRTIDKRRNQLTTARNKLVKELAENQS